MELLLTMSVNSRKPLWAVQRDADHDWEASWHVWFHPTDGQQRPRSTQTWTCGRNTTGFKEDERVHTWSLQHTNPSEAGEGNEMSTYEQSNATVGVTFQQRGQKTVLELLSKRTYVYSLIGVRRYQTVLTVLVLEMFMVRHFAVEWVFDVCSSSSTK